MEVPGINMDGVGLTLGDHPVFTNFSLHLQGGQWHAILGRSGVGKSSLVRLLAGIQLADIGVIRADDGEVLTSRVAYMSQDDGLLPWLSVIDNVQLGPRLRGEKTKQSLALARSLIEQVGMAGWELTLPGALSGGMRQRVALARTLLEAKPVVLMDEPFSRLDAITRDELQSLAFTLLENRTVVLVTHDPVEALRLARTIHVLQGGQPTQTESMQLNQISQPRRVDSSLLVSKLATLWSMLKNEHANLETGSSI